MVNRKENTIDKFIEVVNKDWQLSLTEEEVLNSVLYCFLRQENNEIKKIEHLLNDEIEDLLELLSDYEIQRYAERHLDMIDEECKGLEDYDDDELLEEVDSRGLDWKTYDSRNDIVTESQLAEMTTLFLAYDFNKREEIINTLKY